MGLAASTVHPKNQLTPRERDVMGYIANGQRVRQIADAMGVSVNTVKFHISNIYVKLGAASRREAVQLYEHQTLLACRID